MYWKTRIREVRSFRLPWHYTQQRARLATPSTVGCIRGRLLAPQHRIPPDHHNKSSASEQVSWAAEVSCNLNTVPIQGNVLERLGRVQNIHVSLMQQNVQCWRRPSCVQNVHLRNNLCLESLGIHTWLCSVRPYYVQSLHVDKTSFTVFIQAVILNVVPTCSRCSAHVVPVYRVFTGHHLFIHGFGCWEARGLRSV